MCGRVTLHNPALHASPLFISMICASVSNLQACGRVTLTTACQCPRTVTDATTCADVRAPRPHPLLLHEGVVDANFTELVLNDS